MTLQLLNQQREEKLSENIKVHKVFFAFSDKQFEENKTELAGPEDKYVRFGPGCYIPKSQLEKYTAEENKNSDWFRAQIKEHKLEKKEILHQLYNHECFYTGDITDAVEALGFYSYDEVYAVYLENYNLQE